MNLKFSGQGIAFLNHYKAKTDIRYYLMGVYIRPLPAEAGGGVIGAATNGFMMAYWHDKDGQADRPAILQISPQLSVACGKASEKNPTTLVIRDNRLVCLRGDDETYIQPNPSPEKSPTDLEPWELPGKYPDIARPIPKMQDLTEGPVDFINPEYLAKIARSFPKADYQRSIALRTTRNNEPIACFCPDLPQLAVIVMPITGKHARLVPEWMTTFVKNERRDAQAVAEAPLPGQQPSDATPGIGEYPGRSIAAQEGGAV